MARILLLVLFFNCTGCTYLMVSEAVEQCDRPNVYCGGGDQAEREFKKSAEDAALVNDFKATVQAIGSIAEKVEAKEAEGEDIDYLKSAECEEGKVKLCTAREGCFCE